MHEDEVQDLLDRRDVLLDALADSPSPRDRLALDAELVEVREALRDLDGDAATG